MTSEELLREAESLNPEDRLKLICGLWDTFPIERWPTPSDAELAEIQRRSAEYDAGHEASVPWSEVRERLRSRLSL
jgi:putative addiction module component (TIGR02574 family)